MSEAIGLGQHAERLLQDEVLSAVFTRIEAECVATWTATGFMGTAERERVWMLMKAVEKIRLTLGDLVDGGKIAAAQLVQEQARAPR